MGESYKENTFAGEIYELCNGDADMIDMFEEMSRACLDYTMSIVNIKNEISDGTVDGELEELGRTKGKKHDVTIDSINIFSRLLVKKTGDATWMSKYGLSPGNRASYAKFAILFTMSRL